MITFLKETANKIIEQNSSLKDLVCILPSERAGIHLKKELRELLNGVPSFLPRIISIENFIKEISGLESIDQLTLMFQFYHVYKSTCGSKNHDSFEKFMGWASVVLQDFNEIDRHLVDPKEIFEYLADFQNIKEWSLDRDESTLQMDHYLSFVKDLYGYYTVLTQKLGEQKQAYQGLMYRKAHQKVDAYLERNPHKNFYFIGFNALNKAEEEIFQAFLTKPNHLAFWDVDLYYTATNHEAGTFVKEYFNQWKCLSSQSIKQISKDHFNKKKNIHIVGAPLNVTGIKYATSVLGQDLDYKKTAMVLAEESMLPVVLNSIPRDIKQVNVTMGYALNNIPLTGFFKTLFELYHNKKKLGKNAFYHRDIIALLKHSYAMKICPNQIENAVEFIQKNNLIFLSPEKVLEICNHAEVQSSMSALFKSQTIKKLFNHIQEFLVNLEKKVEGIDLLFVEKYQNIFDQIVALNDQYQEINSIKAFQKVFHRLLSLESVDFKGDALEGLQLMGVLETRCLDFENVIITSVNEGVLPSGQKERSFISFEVKKQFNMPTHLAKDAVFSYHFYRLIQRAKNIYLIYNNNTDEFGGGEMSRFLTQLTIDKPDEVLHQLLSVSNRSISEKDFRIAKTPGVMQVLLSYFHKGISPSRITDYINDPLTFYKTMVLKIREVESVEEEVAFNTLGTIVHDSLEILYQPYLKKRLDLFDFKEIHKQVASVVLSQFKAHFKQGEIQTGKNRLIKEVALQFVRNMLFEDKSLVQKGHELIILDLENEYKIPITTTNGHAIFLKGKIDRVDELDGVRRIIDYKTGKVEPKDLRLSDFSLAFQDYKYHKIVQVMTYVLLYTQTKNFDVEINSLTTGIYSFKNLQAGFLAMNFAAPFKEDQKLITKEKILDFKDHLSVLLDEILDSSVHFIPNLENPYLLKV